mmetsp:Transcript_32772/g.50024  ORF Transcript_32772/g.50024 Transcript_32772/m.50024 type:complete len:95 (-) Transcript_32772:2454-2738(-)
MFRDDQGEENPDEPFERGSSFDEESLNARSKDEKMKLFRKCVDNHFDLTDDNNLSTEEVETLNHPKTPGIMQFGRLNSEISANANSADNLDGPD